MAISPTAPESVPEQPSTDASALVARLDTLLERYLTTLHEYERSREQGNTNFKNGLFSLAEANFRSPNRTRYGQDLYDDKMQATYEVEHVLPETHLVTHAPMPTLRGNRKAINLPSKDTPAASKGSQVEVQDESPSATAKNSGEEASGQTGRALQDPIRQFGVLVPPALRTAQSSFNQAVEGWFGSINASRQLLDLEIEVRRVRKQLKRLS